MTATPAVRRALATGLAAAVALTLAGCGNKLDEGAAPAKTLTYWSSWATGTPQQKIISAALDDYTKATGIKVQANWLGVALHQQLPTAIPAGSGPDVFDSAADRIGSLDELGFVTDLAPLLQEKAPGDTQPIGQIVPDKLLDAARTKTGKLGFLPHTFVSTVIWYNAAEHPEIAQKSPATWDEFVALLDKLKAGGNTPISQDGLVNNYNVRWFTQPMLRCAGPGSFTALGTTKDASGWDDPCVLKAAKAVEQLAKGGYFQKGYEGSKYPAAQNEWAQNKMVFNLNGTWLASETTPQQAPGFKPATFFFPTLEGAERPVTEVGALGWAISSKAKEAEGAKKLITFLMQKKYDEQIAQASNIPARGDVKANEVLEPIRARLAEATEVTKTFDNAPAETGPWYTDILTQQVNKLIYGQIDAATFVKETKAKTVDYLANKG